MIVSSNQLKAYQGRDIQIGFTYTPPAGELLDNLTITAALENGLTAPVQADSLTFNPTTGAVVAIWQEPTTANLVPSRLYEARFTRTDGIGNSRVFYIRPVFFR